MLVWLLSPTVEIKDGDTLIVIVKKSKLNHRAWPRWTQCSDVHMLADGAGTEKCHHVVKSIPSFALKKKKERNPQEGRGEKRKDYWASTWSQFSIAFLVQPSVSILIKRLLFWGNIVFITQFQMKIADMSKGDSMVHKQIIKQSSPRASLSI